MRPRGRPASRWAALIVTAALSAGSPALACSPGLSIVQLSDGRELARLSVAGFSLEWRHSVTLTTVAARYVIGPDGLRQTEERFSAHGPGMAYDGVGWRRDGDAFVLALDRPVPRLVLRSAPEHRNRLIAEGVEIDLTQWPGQPLELLPSPCPPSEHRP